MFHGRRVNNKINHLHERSLRTVCKDNYSSYVGLLVKDKLFTNHHRNIQSLAIELFQVKPFKCDNVQYLKKKRKLTYNLRSQADFLCETASIPDAMV